MTKLFASPYVRLTGRALLAGLAVAFTTLQQSDEPFGKAALLGAATAGAWAVVEAFTPLNALLGKFKQP